MGMPGTGSIAIKNNALATCSSICAATLGSTGSLVNASIIAGKTAPHCLREFYSFCRETSYKCVDMVAVGSRGSNGTFESSRWDCIRTLQTMTLGQCYTVILCSCIQGTSCTGTLACSGAFCNGSAIYSCVAAMNNTPISFSRSVVIRYGDIVCTCITAVHPIAGGNPAYACVTKYSVSPTLGLFCSTGSQSASVYSC